MNKKVIPFRINGCNRWFSVNIFENNGKSTKSKIKAYISRIILNDFAPNLSEATLMGLYNAFYGGSIQPCNFCGEHLSWVDFDLNISDDGILEMIPHLTKVCKCKNKDCRHKYAHLNPNSIEYVSKAYDVSESHNGSKGSKK